METGKKFDKEHIMRWLKPLLSWDYLYEHYEWDEESLGKYQYPVNWTNIARNKRIKWNARMIEKFKERIDWNTFSWEGPVEVYTAEHLEKFKEYWNWYLLSQRDDWDPSEELLDAFADYWDWDRLHGAYKLSRFTFIDIEKYFAYLKRMSRCELRKTDITRWMRLEVAKDFYDVCSWDSRFYFLYQKENDDWQKLSSMTNIRWRSKVIALVKDYIDWDLFSSAKDEAMRREQFRYRIENLEKFKDYWNWDLLSENGYLNWSYKLLDRFVDRWNWSKIVDNWGVVFNNMGTITPNSVRAFIGEFVARYRKYISGEALNASLMGEILRRDGDWTFIFTKPYLERHENQMRPCFFNFFSLETKWEWDYELLDKYVDYWDWRKLINNDGLVPLFLVDFVVRYQRYIPWDDIGLSLLGDKIREELWRDKGKDAINLLLTDKK